MSRPGRLGIAARLLVLLLGCHAAPGPDERLRLAEEALSRGEAAVALDHLCAALPDRPGAATRLGRLARSTGGQETALAALEEALSRRPDDRALLLVAATLELDLQRRGSAERRLRRALGGEGLEDLPVRLQLARLLAESQRFAEGLELLSGGESLLRRSLDGSPAAGRPLALLLEQKGRLLLALGRSGESAATFEESARYRPDSAEAHYGLGMARLLAGDLERAAPSLEKARSLDPSHLEAAYQSMNVAERLGRAEAAASAREAFLALYRERLSTAGGLELLP